MGRSASLFLTGMIYYSHVNEDNRIERTLLREAGGSTVVAICGSGERVLSLMDHEACKKFIIVDFNEQAIFLLQLKLAALAHLSVHHYLQFIGHYFLTKNERLQLYEKIKQYLPADALDFWNLKKATIAHGILNAGHFEKFLNRVRPLTIFYLGKKFTTIFDGSYQKNSFPEKRWRLLKKLFSGKIIYKLAGNKDVAFIGETACMRHIPSALDGAIKENNASTSFMVHLIFKGHLSQMQEKDLPPSLQKEILGVIKERLMKEEITVDYYVADLLDFLDTRAGSLEKPVFYSISDILSFTDFNYLKKLVKRMASKGNVIAGRSFLRHRLTVDNLNKLSVYGDLKSHDEQESTGMYQIFSLKVK